MYSNFIGSEYIDEIEGFEIVPTTYDKVLKSADYHWGSDNVAIKTEDGRYQIVCAKTNDRGCWHDRLYSVDSVQKRFIGTTWESLNHPSGYYATQYVDVESLKDRELFTVKIKYKSGHTIGVCDYVE